MSNALFDKYGGFKSISRIVMDFYDKVLDSDRIGDFFDGIDMPKLIDHQTKFIAALLGGPVSYSNERLRRAHASLELTHEDFDEIRMLLSETLAEHGFSAHDIETVMIEIESRRTSILATGLS